jgi:hypothetical protein
VLSPELNWLKAVGVKLWVPSSFFAQNESVVPVICSEFMRWSCSNPQVELQPSRLMVLPSSHCSPASRMPLPQTAAGVVQTPLVQLWPLAQTCPHAPQLLGSLCTFAHTAVFTQASFTQISVPEQTTSPAAQATHACPHAPQFCVVFRLTQAPPQSPKPELQEATVHAPLTQAGVPFATLQTLPQAPQLLTSFIVFTHALPHETSPAGHVHTPLAHDAPEAHLFPHAPQLFGSDVSLTHAPLHNASPEGQVHAPPTHAWPAAQTFPHAPQLLGSDPSLTHTPPHNTCPA